MAHTSEAYRTGTHRGSDSGCIRLPVERVDEAAARMLGVGADRAKRLRLSLVAEAITAILTACRNDAEKATNFRRNVLAAVAGTEPVAFQPSLLRDVVAKSGATDLATLEASIDGMTDSERRTLLTTAKGEIAALTVLVESLEAL